MKRGRRCAAPEEAYGLLVAPLRGLRRARSARLMHVRPNSRKIAVLTFLIYVNYYIVEDVLEEIRVPLALIILSAREKVRH